MALLEGRNLTKRFAIRRGVLRNISGWIPAVDQVNLGLEPGTTLGLVGESGCGKTTVGRLLLGLLRPDDGTVVFEGRPLSEWLRTNRQALRRRMQAVFQDPLDSLDPRFTVARVIVEPLRATKACPPSQLDDRVRQALEEVQLVAELAGAYPHELSGGQRQRVGIARAMAVQPALVICDEPVSSLDLSIQAQILQLLRRLQAQHHIAYLFISHDLAVIEAMSDQVAVMYLGSVVELAPAKQLLAHPWHPYTEALLAALPRVAPGSRQPVQPLAGEPPSPTKLPSGCRFRTRCPIAKPVCAEEEPPLLEKARERFVACHFRP